MFKIIFYDFDGVMTDNKVYLDQKGNEMVRLSRADGLGVNKIKSLGVLQIIISSEKNPVVSMRAKKLGLQVFQSVSKKASLLKDICSQNNVPLSDVAFVGNDINDKEAMEISGYKFCPADSHQIIKKLSDHIFLSKGGNGVIRELYDFLKTKKKG